ncbi:hypothetical protein KUTeg_016481 [Tegillarca granosa]|uniref:SSD domain-containing protein n=1 Tax=Tegillarca granosa TaxID=220873 RepID=A0ABQ9EPU8_TEGGR|nr:hypothetical protein KUTeg_016481 [Tegillarca granosa]
MSDKTNGGTANANSQGQRNCLKYTSNLIIGSLETETSATEKLWVPESSRIQAEKVWVMKHFPPVTRFASLIFLSNNILSKTSLKAMLDIYNKAKDINVDGTNLDSMCVRVGPLCRTRSLLELWHYNETIINSLENSDILDTVNNVTRSPLYHDVFDITTLLGKIRRDSDTGRIIGAEAASMLFLLQDKQEWREAAMTWELDLVNIVKQGHRNLNNIYIYTTRSFDDEGYGAVNNDTKLLSAGFIIVLIFLVLTLGRFNLLEQKVFLSLAGILCVGLSIAFAYGFAIACGVLYGPVHALMPFMLLGIGVDDMFVIVESWKNLAAEELDLPLPDRIALALKHAGVSVTVTSITDIVAFAIGASTVIPGLSAFCIYAALGILGLYLLVSTFFVACLTLDQLRVEASRDGCLMCYKHKDYVPNQCSQKNLMALFSGKYYGPVLMKLPVKIVIVIFTFTLLGFNIWGFINLRQEFDLIMYIPSNSYAHKYARTKEDYFPDEGINTAVYCDSINFQASKNLFDQMHENIASDPYIQNGTMISWYLAFKHWIVKSGHPAIAPTLNADVFPYSKFKFEKLLQVFAYQTREGRAYARYLKFSNTTIPTLEASYIEMKHTHQPNSEAEIIAMENLRFIVDNSGFPDGSCFAYNVVYLTYETNKVLQNELYRNLALAGLAVFFVTLILIAHIRASLIVFTCVVFTVVDVAGTLYFWGVSIDTASSILLTLSVGLAVDYAAHIGHTFMVVNGTKNERSIKTLEQIGPAVFNGGFSTLLAFVLLSNSYSYGFSLFFRVFFLVVIFGLFHGLAYLPVVLSWIGPDPYCSNFSPKHAQIPQKSEIYSKELKVLSYNVDESQNSTDKIVLGNGNHLDSNTDSFQSPCHLKADVKENHCSQKQYNSVSKDFEKTNITSDMECAIPLLNKEKQDPMSPLEVQTKNI